MFNNRIRLLPVIFLVISLLVAGCYQPASGVTSPAATPCDICSFKITTPARTATNLTGQTPLKSLTPTGSKETGLPQPENTVKIISLSGPVAQPEAELSGMAWYSNTLLLLPQYPSRFGTNGNGALLALTKAEILDYIDGIRKGPLIPVEVPFIAPGLDQRIKGFEGYESIAVKGQQIFLTIEANPGKMMGYLVSGLISPGLREIRLNVQNLAEITPQASIPNYADEALMIAGNRLFSFFEANGILVNPHPVTHLYTFNLSPDGTLPIPNLEYRITDATPPDSSGYFWVINSYNILESELKPSRDPLSEKYNQSTGFNPLSTVERLVEFQFTENGITLADRAPIQLVQADKLVPRNWEALARLDDLGFLLATDSYPSTILGFVSVK
ncbi:MAG: hypothetical protein ACM3PY_17550 [Omnitrophica WOR_2 bacterium]